MKDVYENPLSSRYAGKDMLFLFSELNKFRTWRRLWIALAEGEKELGLPITDAQIEQMKAFADDINFDVAEKREAEVRHDVMAHVYAYGVQCPDASPIIHLGATSCFVTDNADLIIMHSALQIIKKKLVNCIAALKEFALKYKDLPALGFTHFQPAQLVTVGKRACLWLQDLLLDYEDLEYMLSGYMLRGVKGTTGTQASFLTLFDGDGEKVKKLEEIVVRKMGFERVFPVSGQTYTRKQDLRILNVLAGIAQSAYKFANDIRLLQHLKEIEEPFEKAQIGSSAMAYKRNPMRSERICSLARYAAALPETAAHTAGTQWFERTLDDSAARRIILPQAFLTVDAILNIYLNVAGGLVVYEKVIEKHISEELPFMAMETVLMEAVKRGGDRQLLHERQREHSMAAARRVKAEGKENDLLSRIAGDPAFGMSADELKSLCDARRFVGRAPEQTVEFVHDHVEPVLTKNAELLGETGEVNV